jgi:hypothetical protein
LVSIIAFPPSVTGQIENEARPHEEKKGGAMRSMEKEDRNGAAMGPLLFMLGKITMRRREATS